MVLIHNMPENSGSHPLSSTPSIGKTALLFQNLLWPWGRDKEGRNTHYLQPLRGSLQQDLGCLPGFDIYLLLGVVLGKLLNFSLPDGNSSNRVFSLGVWRGLYELVNAKHSE